MADPRNMADPRMAVARGRPSALEINKVLRNTYALLSVTLLFSAFMALVSMAVGVPYLGLWMLLPFFGLIWAIHRTANSVWGLVWTFALTGFLGVSLGPILNYYLMGSGGGAIVVQALAITALSFMGLSAYTIVSKQDFSFLRGFLIVAAIAIVGSFVASAFFQFSSLMVQIISVVAIFFGAALILYETSAVVRGEQTNYILATVGIFVGLYNIFTSLLALLGMNND